MSEALDERVLEASVTAALERIRNERQKFPDQRLALERELSVIETRLHHLVEAIASGRATDKVFDSLNEVEARKKVVVQQLSRLDSHSQVVSLDAKRLVKDLRSHLGDLPALFRSSHPTSTSDASQAYRRAHYGRTSYGRGKVRVLFHGNGNVRPITDRS